MSTITVIRQVRSEEPVVIYVFHLLDKPGAAALRDAVRPQHKAYLGQVADRIAFAGPLLSDDGRAMVGSLLAIDFDSREAAQCWQQEEPFTKAGLYAGVAVHAFQNLWPQKAGFAPEAARKGLTPRALPASRR